MLGVTLARSEVSSLVSVEWVEEEEEEEVCLPGHGPVQAFGQRNRLQEGLQHSELVRLICDR